MVKIIVTHFFLLVKYFLWLYNLRMYNNIYLVRDKVSQVYNHCFPAVNDGSAVRSVCDMFGKSPHFKDLELVRFDYGFDIQTGRPVNSECAVIALPEPDQAPKMPLSQGSATVEVER